MNAPSVKQAVHRCALYLRVSTDQQAMRKDGSLDTQEDLLRRVLEQKNALGERWELVRVYREEGASGKDMHRPRFREMMADIDAGLANMVVFTRIDRVSRNVMDFLRFVDHLNQKGVGFLSLHEQVDTSTPAGRLQLTLMIALAEHERAVISARAAEKSHWRAAQGLWGGGQLLGYEPKDGTLVPVEHERVAVEAIFRVYLQTNSLKRTAKVVSRMGFRTKAYTSRRGKVQGGKPLKRNHVYNTLTNPAYIGKVRQHGKIYDAQHPAIIDEALFNEVQRRLARNRVVHVRKREKSKYVFPLESLLRCGYCGGALTPSWSKGRDKYYRYYYCGNHRNDDLCHMGRINADQVEAIVGERLVQLSAQPAILEAVLAQNNSGNDAVLAALEDKQRALTNTLRSIDGQLANLIAFVAKGDQSKVVRDHLAKLETQREQVEGEIEKVRQEAREASRQRVSAPVIKASLNTFALAYAAATPEQRKQLFQLLINEVVFTNEKIRLALHEVELPTGPTNEPAAVSTGMQYWYTRKESNLQPSDP